MSPNPSQNQTGGRPPAVVEYFRFAAWLSLLGFVPPRVKAQILEAAAATQFFGAMKGSAGIICKGPAEYLVVSHDEQRCFVVKPSGFIAYARYDRKSQSAYAASDEFQPGPPL